MALMLMLLLAVQTLAAPPLTLHDLEAADGADMADSQTVGSYIREVRAAAPEDYHKSYENEGDGEIGYSRKKDGGGKKGYQHFDAYHKAAGDHYEFEKADSFGHDDDHEEGAHSQPQHTKARYQAPSPAKKRKNIRNKRQPELADEESSSEAAYGHYEEPSESSENDEEPKKKKKGNKRPEEDENHPHYEELKEGASDGNGGVEAVGHDPEDYQLPEKYTWEPEEF